MAGAMAEQHVQIHHPVGWQSWRSVVGASGMRRLLCVFPMAASGGQVQSIRCYANTYPYVITACLTAASASNKAWEISRRTIVLCNGDTFVDCPARAGFWVGDARNESLFAYIFRRLSARRCLLLAGESLFRSPCQSQVPSGWTNIHPPGAYCGLLPARSTTINM